MGDENDRDEQGHTSTFEAIRHTSDAGGEYWSARELAKVLTYANWQNFAKVIEQAQKACANSGRAPSDHFIETSKMIPTGKGAQRRIVDFHLSRYACYLIVQNGDPDKPVIAAGQTYFAEQTRRQQLADELAQLPPAQRRIAMRDEVVHRNVDLAATAAAQAGLVSGQDFAVFQDHGYMGLYAGERTRDIAARKGLRKGEKILDWMDSEELAANWFRITQTEAKLRRDPIAGKDAANATHHAVGREVRETIQRLGGTMPEDLPTPAESVQQLKARERQRAEEARDRDARPSLFPELDTRGEEGDA